MTVDILPSSMNPIDILGPAKALHDVMECCTCNEIIGICSGVLYEDTWGLDGNTAYGYAFFCSLTCLIAGVEAKGTA